MEIKHTEIVNGQRDGEILFVCDYRRPDKNKKPIRSLPPTEVMVMSNSTTSKRVYYSESHFRPLGKDNTPKSRVIPVFDNTGYRMLTGNPVYIFTTEEECVSKWNEMIQEEIDWFEESKKTAISAIEAQISDLEGKKA